MGLVQALVVVVEIEEEEEEEEGKKSFPNSAAADVFPLPAGLALGLDVPAG
ncbi:MAG: hypothetical protein ACRCUQ_00460 [Alphaproteobacteria bacterium]